MACYVMCEHKRHAVLEHPMQADTRVRFIGRGSFILVNCMVILFVRARRKTQQIWRSRLRLSAGSKSDKNMSETAQLVELLRQQLETQRKQMETLVAALSVGGSGDSPETPFIQVRQQWFQSPVSFHMNFDSSLELWHDYWTRFQTFAGANLVPANKTAQVFLTNQSRVTYKLLFNLAAQ